MTAKTEKKLDIQKIIKDAVTEAVKTTVFIGNEKAKVEHKNTFKQTEIRLYAYPELRNNILKYQKDIDDLHREEPGRSKDIVFYSAHGGGTRLSAEEIQEGRIMVLQKKIFRDQAEIDEIEYALSSVKTDEYYRVVEMKYFKGLADDEIGQKLSCDASTVRRNKSRLVRRIAVKLYGAEAVG